MSAQLATHQGTGFAVTLDGVTKAYPLGDGRQLRAADEISLDITAGSSTALIGPSGSGKSTLLHLIGAIDRPDAGTITVDGTDLTTLSRRDLADYRARIGFIFQQFHLLPALTADDNVLAPLVSRKTNFNRRERAHELLHAVGLTGRETALPSQLSGGQQQRVAIARALVNNPGLLLADEPTGNLDSVNAGEIIALLEQLQADRGATLIIATHNTEIAARCQNVLHIHDGQLS